MLEALEPPIRTAPFEQSVRERSARGAAPAASASLLPVPHILLIFRACVQPVYAATHRSLYPHTQDSQCRCTVLFACDRMTDPRHTRVTPRTRSDRADNRTQDMRDGCVGFAAENTDTAAHIAQASREFAPDNTGSPCHHLSHARSSCSRVDALGSRRMPERRHPPT